MFSLILMLRRLDERGAVAMIFGLSLIPLLMAIGFAVDYGFFVQARSQINLAADAAAMHAVRVASQAYGNGLTTVAAGEAAGQQAGQQWFDAQLGTLKNAVVSDSNVNVSVTYTQSPGGFSASVSYTGTVPTHFSQIFGVNAWTVSNATVPSSAVITNQYVEIDMMIDNSSSMLIGATLSDMLELEKATPCSTQSTNEGQGMGNYSWYYPSTYGYSSGQKVPQPSNPPPSGSACYSAYTGDSSACFYIPNFPASIPISTSTGLCTNGGGSNGSAGPVGTPQAPCALACHNDANGNDYYGLSQSLNPKPQLRLNVVHTAAANVITALSDAQQAPNQFSVGVYEFNNTLQKVYPSASGGEAGTDLATALADVNALQPPVTTNQGNTYFSTAVNSLVPTLTASGDGSSPTKPVKSLFIVTDGMQDNGSYSAFTNPSNETTCQKFKNLGFTVYVLYTPYLPLPNPWYLTYIKGLAEPTNNSQVTAALQACATSSTTFFQASDPTAINTAMQAMLKSALNTASRIAQ